MDENNYSEYIVRVADFHLNRSIRRQCAAFREGFTSVIDQAWIKLFDQSEFSILVQGKPCHRTNRKYMLRTLLKSLTKNFISGVKRVIDVEDLKSFTQYNGFVEPNPQLLPQEAHEMSESHVTIQAFWKVIAKFTPEEREKFLRFVTSHSRAPLRGFRDLEPRFSIMNTREGSSCFVCRKFLKINPKFCYLGLT